MQPKAIEGLITSIKGLLEQRYVFPDVAREISSVLTSRLSDGGYAGISTEEQFARLVTEDLQSVNHDKHLVVSLVPSSRREAGGDPAARRLELMKEHNFGFEQVRVMDANVGYVQITALIDPKFEGAGDAAVQAMAVVSNADCLIFDLRENGGGSPAMIQLLTTYLFEGDPIHLNSFYLRETDSYKQFWTLPYVPGKRMPGVPVYVLTSGRTFSGAEEFCYNLKTLRRGTIVGAVTGGGAHPGDEHPLNERLEIFVPHGRAINPVTNTNWEGVGVQPDVVCPPEDALQAAYDKHVSGHPPKTT